MAGTAMSGMAAFQQAQYQKRVALQNASLEREQIGMEQEATRQEALNHYRRLADLKGQQRAVAAANGVSTDFGTAVTLVQDTAMLGREDANNIYGQSFQRLRGIDRGVGNSVAESRAASRAATGALVSTGFSMASTALGSAQQYRALRAAAAPRAASFPNPGPSNYWSN